MVCVSEIPILMRFTIWFWRNIMKHVPIRSTLVVVAMLAMLIVSLTVSAQAQPAPTEAGAVRWLTYVDPRFDFSI
jgi:hypothetical protein